MGEWGQPHNPLKFVDPSGFENIFSAAWHYIFGGGEDTEMRDRNSGGEDYPSPAPPIDMGTGPNGGAPCDAGPGGCSGGNNNAARAVPGAPAAGTAQPVTQGLALAAPSEAVQGPQAVAPRLGSDVIQPPGENAFSLQGVTRPIELLRQFNLGGTSHYDINTMQRLYAHQTLAMTAVGGALGGAGVTGGMSLAGGGMALVAEEGVASGVGFGSFEAFKDTAGAAGANMQWHHVVEQTATNLLRFGPTTVHNTGNLIRVEATLHTQISAYYSSIQPFTGGMTVRAWLSSMSFEAQQVFGREILVMFGAL